MEPLTTDNIWKILEAVKDPEIPVVSVVEMGIIRSIGVDDASVVVTMTPTYSGCPALQVMQEEIEERLLQAGAHHVQINVTLTPPWTTEWITEQARQKLKEYGLAPPQRHSGRIDLTLIENVICPYCDSDNTSLKNSFGPTLCRQSTSAITATNLSSNLNICDHLMIHSLGVNSIKLVALYKQPPDVAAFDDAYFNTHLPLLSKVPGLEKTVITRFNRVLMGDDFHLLAEMTFQDADTLKVAMKSPEMAAAGANLNPFAEGLVTLLFGEEQV